MARPVKCKGCGVVADPMTHRCGASLNDVAVVDREVELDGVTERVLGKLEGVLKAIEDRLEAHRERTRKRVAKHRAEDGRK